MAQKTKATMPGRQCSTENREQNQHTRPVAGGQSMSQRNFAPSDFIQFCTLGTAALAQLVRTALQHTQYFPQWGECEPVAGALILRTSFRVAQLQLGISPQNWGNPDFGCGTYTKNAGRTPELAFAQPFGSIPRCCNSLRNIRLIHVARDESPSLRISSSSCARNSSLKRIWYCGDFFNSCIDMCNYPDYHLSVITRVITFSLKSNAPDCSSSAEASNQTVK